jgi:BirA family biotin operon repressor/biotin-[acetyl-CoA-carboxylase] ligase
LAESRFDRARFHALLVTRRLGHHLIARGEAESTNDLAWDALAAGAPEGTVVVADVQTRGRGRDGRGWHTAPGKGLALSALVAPGCDARDAGALPLIAGLALARGLDTLGVRAELRWPNDVLHDGRKLAGILCESRRGGAAPGTGAAVVVGVGLNVLHARDDWPADIAGTATSLALAGHAVSREQGAAAFLNAFEPLLDALEAGGVAPLLDAWRERAAFWGQPVRARTAGGEVRGIARRLDARGALVLALEDGREATVVAGDVERDAAAEGERP